MSDEVQLTDAEERVLAFHGWGANGRADFLHRALGLTAEQWRAAEDRLLELGFIEPCPGAVRQ